MITLDTLNVMPVAEFVMTLGAIFEHSPWVAERAAAARPFTSRLALLDAMRAVVWHAPVEEQLGLIRAHPQLGARGRNRAQLTQASAREQRRAGLDACTDEEFAELLRLNHAYVGKFSFPFILAVRGHGPDSILASIGGRLNNDPHTERHTALTQIGLIGGYRLADVVASAPGAEIAAMSERLESGRQAAVGDQSGALLREWLLGVGLEVFGDHDMVGVARGEGSHLLLGAYHDGELRRDGCLATLVGIAVAQELRQRQAQARTGLLVLASGGAGGGSALIGTDVLECVALSAAEIESLAPLRAAGIMDHCVAIAGEGDGDATAAGGARGPAGALTSGGALVSGGAAAKGRDAGLPDARALERLTGAIVDLLTHN